MRQTKLWTMALVVGLMLALAWSCGSGGKPPLLNKDTAITWLSDPNVIVLDVRAPKDWRVSHKKIKGAVRQEPDEVEAWAPNLPRDSKILLYCQREGTIVRVATHLRQMGFKLVWGLKGGWEEWEKRGYPTEPK